MKILLKIHDFTSFFLLVLLLCSPAMAAEQSFMPTSGWLVGPASLETNSADNKMPCIAANQFADGLTVRFSGGGGQLMAMAIDFRQKVFKPRQKYDVEFSMPGHFFQVISGAAYDDETLVFSLFKMQDFYQALQKAETLSVKTQGAAIVLSMAGLPDGLQRLEACYAPDQDKPAAKSAEKTPARRAAKQNPLIAESSGLTPMPGEPDLLPARRISDDSDEAPAAPVQPRRLRVPQPQQDRAQQDQAQQEQDTAAALIAGAKQAEQAAQALAKKSPAKPQPAGEQMAPSWTQPKQRRKPEDVLTPPAVAQAAAAPQIQLTWQAVKGNDLRQVLSDWAAGSGFKILWLPKQNFKILQSFSTAGDFAFASQMLLDQYATLPNRPVGRIYRDPASSRLVLVVEQQARKAKSAAK